VVDLKGFSRHLPGMADSRLPDKRVRPQPRAQFRCPVCQKFVRATDQGFCPGCGRAPTHVPMLGRGQAGTRRGLLLVLGIVIAVAVALLTL
jgi:hypothetical protein